MSLQRFIQIDEEGYLTSSGLRVNDDNYGRTLLENLRVEARGFVTQLQGEKIIAEAFDQPLVARHIEIVDAHQARAKMPYGFSTIFRLDSLKSDPWDRFHARTLEHDVPLVLSRAAQMELFNAADSFDDESITLKGERTLVSSLYRKKDDVNQPEFWANKYSEWQSGAAKKPAWEINGPAAPLASVLNQIKMPRSRICVLGCGSGHDVAHFAEQGHFATGVDWSEEAILLARQKYAESKHLHFAHEEAFDFAKSNTAQFDVIFEHTFFCAIEPSRREDLIRAWRRMLTPGGHLLGIFFILDQTMGPPFGITEWELRELLKPHFEFLFWTRWKHSTPDRLGRELVIYARKRG